MDDLEPTGYSICTKCGHIGESDEWAAPVRTCPECGAHYAEAILIDQTKAKQVYH